MAYPPNALPTNATDGSSPTDTTATAVLTEPEPVVMCGGWVLIDGVWTLLGEDEI